MVFSSIIFLFYFLPLFLIAFHVLGRRKEVILPFSLVFYAWGEPIYIVLMVLSIIMNHWFGLSIERNREKTSARAWVIAGVVTNLLPLIGFKYTNFLLGIADSLFGSSLGTSVGPIALPLGISFFTFHAISYLVDVYRRDVPAERNLVNLAVYISMFPQLVAGPIIRFKTIAGELHNPVVTIDRTAEGIRMFVIGLGQKVLIANTVATVADAIFALPSNELSTSLAWLGAAAYMLQIYHDFCGYSNMALGLGLMIGFTFPINFNYPYVSRSITEFWRRWHISLSSWFRDYVYISLGGNRISPARTYINLLIVFLLCGIWHGAAWTFLIWGLFHGVLLVVERIGFGKLLGRMPPMVGHAYTLLAVMIGWVVFRAGTLEHAGTFLAAMAGHAQVSGVAPSIGRFAHTDVIAAFCVGVLTSAPLAGKALSWAGDRMAGLPLRVGDYVAVTGLLVIFVVCTVSLAGGTYNPFIYFRF